MCIIFWTLDNHPKYKFIFAGNRDEFLSRPTSRASFWSPPYSHVLAGRDLEHLPGTGTWLGISKRGFFTALTNYREDQSTLPKDIESRGYLVRDFLLQEGEDRGVVEGYLKELGTKGEKFGGFSIVCVDLRAMDDEKDEKDKMRMGYYTNRDEVGIVKLQTGTVHGLSNSVYSKPWPKVSHGCEAMREILDRNITNESEMIAEMFELLAITTSYRFPESPESCLEEAKSIIRVPKFRPRPGEDYATQISTVVLVDYDGNVVFAEKHWWSCESGEWVEATGEAIKTKVLRFTIGEDESVVNEEAGDNNA